VYLLLKVANTISPAEGSLRMVSVLSGTAMVVVAAAIGRRVAGNRAGVFAGLAMAVMPAYVAQARDLRMYALASAFVLAGALALWRAVEQPRAGRLLALSACVGLACYSHYFAVVAVTSQLVVAAVILRPSRGTLLRVTLATVGGMATLVPWLLFALPQFQHVGSPFWVQPVGIARIKDLWQEFVAGDQLRGYYPHAAEINNLRLLACGAAAAGGIAWIVAAWRSHGETRRRFLLPAAMGLVPMVALILLSFGRPLYDTRYAAVLEAPLVVAVGLGLAWLWSQRRPWLAALVAVALALVAAHALALGPNPQNDDIRPLVAPLSGQVKDDDFVAIDGATQYFTVLYYTDASTQERTHVIEAAVQWFDGTALYRPDTWLPAIPPTVTGRIYVLADQVNSPLPMPPGYAVRDRRCAATYCLQTWSR
jgi:mannosyltransferase